MSDDHWIEKTVCNVDALDEIIKISDARIKELEEQNDRLEEYSYNLAFALMLLTIPALAWCFVLLSEVH